MRCATPADYVQQIARLGGMVAQGDDADKLLAALSEIREGEGQLDFFPGYAVVRESLQLALAEAACVALWLYHELEPVEPLEWGELFLHPGPRPQPSSNGKAIPPSKRFPNIFFTAIKRTIKQI